MLSTSFSLTSINTCTINIPKDYVLQPPPRQNNQLIPFIAYILFIPANYNDRNFARIFPQPNRPASDVTILENRSFWNIINGNTWILNNIPGQTPRTQVNQVSYSQNSIDCAFLGGTNNEINKFTCIAGQLNTNSLDNCLYDGPTVQSIFEHLKNYDYDPETIFDIITYNLTAFLTATTLQYDITDILNALVKQLQDRQITLDQYNTLVKNDKNKYITKALEIYNKNLVIVEQAIIDNRSILS